MARVWSLSKAARFVDASYEQSTAFSITVPYRANSSLKISDIPTKLNSNFPLYELGNLYGISYYFFSGFGWSTVCFPSIQSQEQIFLTENRYEDRSTKGSDSLLINLYTSKLD